MPQAGEPSLARLMESDGTAEMAADVAQGLDPALPTINEHFMAVHPFGDLTMRLQLADVSYVLKTFLIDGHEAF